jgi:hypothetical protein
MKKVSPAKASLWYSSPLNIANFCWLDQSVKLVFTMGKLIQLENSIPR